MGNQPSARQQAKKIEELSAAARNAAAAEDAGNSDSDDVVDPRVTDRMLKRVIMFSGTPVLLGLLLFPFFWYLKVISCDWRTLSPLGTGAEGNIDAYVQVVQKVDLPMGTVFISSGLAFGAGLLGISYGAVSASWDPAREGSILGWNEFRANFAAIMNQRNSK